LIIEASAQRGDGLHAGLHTNVPLTWQDSRRRPTNELAAFLEQKLVERHPFYKQAHYRLTSDQINESGLKKLIKNHAS
jgi:hypothetical protein